MQDMEGELNIQQGMEYAMDDVEFYKETMQMYVQETGKNIKLMDQYLVDQDMPNYAILVHSLKSSSRLIGACYLNKLAEEMENKSKEGNIAFIEQNHEHLKDTLFKVYESIHEYMELHA